jgi:ABC-2 type transport system ATP-binding protein
VVSLEIEGDSEALFKRLEAEPWIKTRTRHNSSLSLTMEMGERQIPSIVRIAEEVAVSITCVNLHKPSLEDVFLHYTGRRIRDQEANQSEKNRSMMRGHFRRRK